VPAGESVIRQAVRWLDEQLRDRPGADRLALIEDACRRYDLSPADSDFLFRHLAERAKGTKPA
jgi:hypothetical protein